MPCLTPLPAYRLEDGSISFRRDEPAAVSSLVVPCKSCRWCRMDVARQWSVRAFHESLLTSASCFLTLTYSDDNLPHNGSLVRADLDDFCKRMREHCLRVLGVRIRFFGCGEYGERSLRPHYHLIVFGASFTDGTVCGRSGSGVDVLQSPTLDGLWGHGRAVFQSFNIYAAKYIAKYSLAKFDGDQAALLLPVTDPDTGEVLMRVPPFIKRPSRPALGIPFLERFTEDVYAYDEIVLPDGTTTGRVEAYDRWLAERDPERFEAVKDARLRSAIAGYRPDEADRLRARGFIMDQALAQYSREGV